MEKVSLTYFVDFVMKSGTPKLSVVRDFKERDKYEPFADFYKMVREAMVESHKGPLPKKIKELILIAINVATTHLYAPGTRRHMQNALRLGATREELLEVIQLVTVIGIHAVNMAVPILAEELEKYHKAKRAKGASAKALPQVRRSAL